MGAELFRNQAKFSLSLQSSGLRVVVEMSETSNVEERLFRVVNQREDEPESPEVETVGEEEQDDVGRRHGDPSQVFLTLDLLEVEFCVHVEPIRDL